MNIELFTVLSLKVLEMHFMPRKANISARPFHSLSLRLYGENVLEANGREHISDAGKVTFVPAGLTYKENILAKSEIIVAHFVTRENIGSDIEIFHGFPNNNEEELFRSLLDSWNTFPHENATRCMTVFYHIIDIIRCITNTTGPYSGCKFLEDAVKRMYENYCSADFQIQALYDTLYVSEAYFRRVFKQVYGCSPGYFLKQLRVNHAKILLENGIYTIAEIAELSGFASPTYFCYAFKQSTGKTPKEFARSDRG